MRIDHLRDISLKMLTEKVTARAEIDPTVNTIAKPIFKRQRAYTGPQTARRNTDNVQPPT